VQEKGFLFSLSCKLLHLASVSYSPANVLSFKWTLDMKRNYCLLQLVISVLLDDLSSGDLKIQAFSSTLEGTLPYTERHFKRLTQLLQDLHLLQYTAACMQPQLQGGSNVLK
jgi:hypothetical protein